MHVFQTMAYVKNERSVRTRLDISIPITVRSELKNLVIGIGKTLLNVTGHQEGNNYAVER